jgi:hypothetical protein
MNAPHMEDFYLMTELKNGADEEPEHGAALGCALAWIRGDVTKYGRQEHDR